MPAIATAVTAIATAKTSRTALAVSTKTMVPPSLSLPSTTGRTQCRPHRRIGRRTPPFLASL